MRKNLEKAFDQTGAFVLDAVCAYLLLFSLSLTLFPLLVIEASVAECAVYAAIALGICVLFSIGKLTVPLLIGVPAAAAILIAVLQFTRGTVLDYLSGFFRWCIAGLPETEPYSYDLSVHAVRVLILLLPAALVLLFFRKLFFYPPIPLLSLALYLYAQLGDLNGRYLLLAALILLNLAALSRATHRRIRKKLREGARLPEAVMRSAALILGIAAVFLSTMIASAPDGKWKSQGLRRFVSDTSDFVSYLFGGGADKGSDFSLGWSGFSPYGGRLGGDIEPSDRITLNIHADTPTLLMGSVSNEYNGAYWYDGGSVGNFRLGSFFWGLRRREALALSNPRGGKAAREQYKKVMKTVSIRVSPNVYYRNLFFGGVPRDWEFNSSVKEVYFNKQGELYMLEEPSVNVIYTFQTEIPDLKSETFEEDFLLLEQLCSDARDSYYSDIFEANTALPESLPPRVYEIAREITKNAATPAEKAFAIERWLEENCTYTLSPGDVPEGRDFVDYFLETREGYCTYYASAMTVLARCAGLPARYVSGFGMKQNPTYSATYNYLATNATAHAWSQIYFSGIGWVSFDPSDFNFFEPAIVPEKETKPSDKPKDSGSQNPTRTEEEIEPGPIEQIEPEILPPVPVKTFKWIYLIPAFFGALLIAGAVLLLLRWRELNIGPRRLRNRTLGKTKDRSEAAELLFARLVDQLGFLSLYLLPGETLSEFTARCSKALEEEKRFSEGFGAIDRFHYGEREPTKEEIFALCELSVNTEREIRNVFGAKRYLMRRVIFNYNPNRVKRTKKTNEPDSKKSKGKEAA